MPFADPEKRSKYQKQYQRTYYLRNREESIKKSVANKKQRRSEKKDWLLAELGGIRDNLFSQNFVGKIKIIILEN